MKKRLFAAFFLLGAFFASFIVAAWRLLHLAGLNPWLALLPGSAVLLWISAFAARFAARWMTRPLTELDLQHPEDATVPEEMSPLLLRVARQNREVRSQIDALEARRDELDALMEGMQEGFIALDTQENIIVINPSACAMLGTDEAFALGRHLSEINRDPRVMALLGELRSSGAAQGVLEREGRSYRMSVSRLKGREGAVLLLGDQTEKYSGEAMRKRFTANVSHELRTPLTTISGYSEMLQSGMTKPEDVARFAGLIHRESARMLRLVEDILRLSRLDEGYAAGKNEQVNLFALAQEAGESLLEAAREKHVALTVSGADAFVRGDVTLLMEMCFNLMDNAVKYNVENGSVSVDVRGNGSHVLLRVKDTGIGIAPEHRALVFERFYRVDPSRSKQTGGTGLGLSIVKHAAEYHQAAVTLKSEVAHGTEVSVLFPAYAENAPAKKEPAPSNR